MEIAEPDLKAPVDEPTVLDHMPGDETTGVSDQIDAVDVDGQPAGTETPGAETPPDPIEELRAQNASLQSRLEELSEKFETKAGEQPENNQPTEPVKEPTPEEWAQHEKAWGFVRGKDENGGEIVSLDPQKIIKTVVSRLGYILDEAKKYADSTVHGNTSDIRFESALADMAGKPGFQDIRSYSDAIKKYLTRYMPKDRSNPKYIEDGLYWARGKNLKNTIQQVKDGREIRKTIVRPGQPSGGAPARTGRLTPESMTAQQKDIALKTFRGMTQQQAFAEYCATF